jgi:malonyl-CoA decarboxylase
VEPHAALAGLLRTSGWVGHPALEPLLEAILPPLAARYLYQEKRRNAALNPVANFHIRNGSCLWRVNWMADLSPRGMEASCGIMVNYRYYLDRLEHNSNSYLTNHTIDADPQVTDLLK